MLSIPILRILSVYIALTVINSIFVFGLLGMGADMNYFKAGLRGGIATVIFLLIATSFGDVWLSAAAVVAGELVVLSLMWKEFQTRIQIGYRPVWLSILCGCIALLVGIYLPEFVGIPSPFSLWFGTGIAWITFTILFFLSGGIKATDIRWLLGKEAS